MKPTKIPISEQNRTTNYVCSLIEQSGRYLIQEKNVQRILITENNTEINQPPKAINVFFPNFIPLVEEFRVKVKKSWSEGIYTLPIFYKDGNNAFVRMVDTNKSHRKDKSFKRYTTDQIKRMLHLRERELAAINLALDNELVYYQPSLNEGIESGIESLIIYTLNPVHLDYSHIKEDEQPRRFVKDCNSIVYRLPCKRESIELAVKFYFNLRDARRNNSLVAKITSTDQITNDMCSEIPLDQLALNELKQMSQHYFPNLSPEDALRALYPE